MQHTVFVRALIVSACLLAGGGMLAKAFRNEIVPIRASLSEFPIVVGEWRGQRNPDFEPEILSVLGVDEYLNRTYIARASLPISVYVGYYQSQRQGDTMHSPLNCLPGAGWIPLERRRIQIPVKDNGADRRIEVNSIVIEKGLDRQLVLYWYQSHGRVVASEYWGKIFLVLDAIRSNRSDGAMIRLVVPIPRTEDKSAAAAEQTAIKFAQATFPLLSTYLPG